MKTYKDVIKNSGYWFEKLQLDFFNLIKIYQTKTGKSNQEIATDLKVSRSRISQLLNGNVNFTLKNLINIVLYTGKVPILKFVSQNTYLNHHKEIDEYFDNIEHVNTDHIREIIHNKSKLKNLVFQIKYSTSKSDSYKKELDDDCKFIINHPSFEIKASGKILQEDQ